MVKISAFMVGLVTISLVITLFNIFLAGLNEQYDIVGYDESNLEAYNKLEEITDQTEDIKGKVTTDIKSDPDILDIIGGFFKTGYKAFKLTYNSFDTFDTMTNTAITDANLGKTGNYLKIAISGIVIILLFIAVAISAILKWGV